jgi:hypothetical protein
MGIKLSNELIFQIIAFIEYIFPEKVGGEGGGLYTLVLLIMGA